MLMAAGPQDHNLRTTVLNQPLKGLGWIVAFLEEIKEILLGPFQPRASTVYLLFFFFPFVTYKKGLVFISGGTRGSFTPH